MTGAPRLINKTSGVEIAARVQFAHSFIERTLGLMGRPSLMAGSTLWIRGSKFIPCNSIHTCFMRFAIDAVFVDRNLKVMAIYRDLKPWRVTAPARGAWSVFELPSGSLPALQLGDQLHVGA